MSVSRVLKKGYASLFNEASISCLFVGAALVAGPSYLIGDAIHPDMSEQRTPDIGARQLDSLDKELTTLLTLKKQGEDSRLSVQKAQQELMINTGNADLQKKVEAGRAAEKDALAQVEGLKKNFLPRVFLSEGISETDAYGLFHKYRTAFGHENYTAIEGGMGHDVARLDECQIEVMQQTSELTADTAMKINACMADSASDREFASVPAVGLYLYLAFNLLIPGLFGIGAAFREDLEKEERDRPEKPKTRTDEVNLKIKIEKPKL